MMQMMIKTKTFDKYKIIYLSKVLPATFTLVASNTKWDDIVEVVTLIIINPVSGEV